DILFKDKATFIFEDQASHHPELKLVKSQKILKEQVLRSFREKESQQKCSILQEAKCS
ncbi:hypothetical protein HispidOSU_011913, partial [Sigmodon hispidus]